MMYIGEDTKVWHPELSNHQNIMVGKGCSIHSHTWVGNGVVIGDFCRIQAFTFIPSGVEIGNHVFIGPHVCFTNDKLSWSGVIPEGESHWEKTRVEDKVRIGANSTILPGITLHEGCTIGAGSVVTKNVPAGEVWVGNPARRLK